MKLLQFKPRSDPSASPRIGALICEGRAILDLPITLDGSGRGSWLPPSSSFEWWNLDGSVWSLMRSTCDVAIRADEKTVAQWQKHGRAIPFADAILSAPIPRPGKLVAVAQNYKDHAAELGHPLPKQPVIFSKFSSAIVGPGAPVVIPKGCEMPDFEAELAVVIGRRAKHVSIEQAMSYVFGYCAVNDVTARDFQSGDGQYQRAKSCDTFAPLGPWVVSKDEIENPECLGIQMRLNGKVMQKSTTGQLIFGIARLIEFISAFITLEPGDIICTGTPGGVGISRKPPVHLKAGDQMEVEIDGIGVLANPVTAE